MQRFLKSSVGVSLGLGLGRVTPPNLGYFFATLGAKFLVRRKNSPMVRAVQANQIVVRGQQISADGIKISVEEVFIHAGHCFVDLYHNLQNPIGLKQLSVLTPRLQQLISQSYHDSPGAFIVAPHLSNFDLVLLAAAYRGLKAQVLTYGNPTGGYKIQNDIRAQTGLDITPVNPEIHKKAIQNMRKGGFVITAVDRPVRSKKQVLTFFGYPSPLPAGHIRMAMEADVPIIVVAAELRADNLYHLNISDPIELVHHQDPDEEIRINGEAVLRVIESYIRKTPGQWLMYYPVWPSQMVFADV